MLVFHQWLIAGVIVVAFLGWNAYISNLGYKDRQAAMRAQQRALQETALARDKARLGADPTAERASSGGGKYGRNTLEIRDFLGRLHELTSEQWRKVASTARTETSWQDQSIHSIVGPWAEANQRESQAFVQDLAKVEREAVRRARLTEDEASAIFAATGTAGLALFGREQITSAQFDALYRPFADVIPAASLGDEPDKD